MALSKEQIARYSRQLILPEVGMHGQQRLLDSSVLIIGAGGLGSPAALYLAAAGIGTIGIVDHDPVELSNLHRQILHSTQDIGRAKTASAQERLASLNPDVKIQPYPVTLGPDNARALLEPYSVVLDGSDNFKTRYLVNDACILLHKVLVYGGVVNLRGQLMCVQPKQSACFRCVFPEAPLPGSVPSCQEAGVLGTMSGIIGSLMAHEALKHLLGIGGLLTDKLLVFDAIVSQFRTVPLRRDVRCAVCGDEPSIRELTMEQALCTGS